MAHANFTQPVFQQVRAKEEEPLEDPPERTVTQFYLCATGPPTRKSHKCSTIQTSARPRAKKQHGTASLDCEERDVVLFSEAVINLLLHQMQLFKGFSWRLQLTHNHASAWLSTCSFSSNGPAVVQVAS